MEDWMRRSPTGEFKRLAERGKADVLFGISTPTMLAAEIHFEHPELFEDMVGLPKPDYEKLYKLVLQCWAGTLVAQRDSALSVAEKITGLQRELVDLKLGNMVK